MYDTWKHPATLAIISEVAGIDLVTAMDFEIGTVNISVKSEERKQEELAAIAERTSFEEDEGIAGCPWEDDKPIVDWHRDSYPFVCVTMLSDCSQMVGGETALKTGNGDILKLRGPQMVRPLRKAHSALLIDLLRDAPLCCRDVTLSIKPYVRLAPLNALPWSPRSGLGPQRYPTTPF